MVRDAREINFLAWHKGIKEFKLFLYEYARINMNKDGDYNHTHLLCILTRTYVPVVPGKSVLITLLVINLFVCMISNHFMLVSRLLCITVENGDDSLNFTWCITISETIWL